jgi:hypothetical protein
MDNVQTITVFGPPQLAVRAWQATNKEFSHLPDHQAEPRFPGTGGPSTLLFRVWLNYECPPVNEVVKLSEKEPDFRFVLDFGAYGSTGRCQFAYVAGRLVTFSTAADSAGSDENLTAIGPEGDAERDQKILLAIAKVYFEIAANELRFAAATSGHVHWKYRFLVNDCFDLYEKLKKLIRPENKAALDDMEEELKQEPDRLWSRYGPRQG